jgi:hypothetical protein
MSVDEIGGHGTGKLSCGSSAHSIRYHEQRAAGSDLMSADSRLETGVPGAQIGYQKRVLVVVAGASQVGLAEDRNSYRAAAHVLLGQMQHLQR